ncbi:RecE family exodeoxyribonuclease, partial [Pantoea sp.]|uniref:RecE family exodeoxyribonuclease n=1 Tax=Pantoea sp. TaxID=69393 RepID=UPI0028A5ECEA
MSELKPFFIYFRAKKKSGQKDLVFWETRATENRVIRDAVNAMEDAGLSEDDFFSPVATNFHVVDELPPEGEIDVAWCERYQLGDDKMTWELIPGAASADTNTTDLQQNDNALQEAVNLEDLTVEQAVISAWLYGRKDELTREELNAVSTSMMDTDASFPQNLLLVARSAQVMQLQHAYKSTVADWVDSAKSVWSPEGTAPQLADLLKFTSEWLDAHNDSSARAEGNGNRRSDITAKWADRVSKKASGSKASAKETTVTGATAGGGNSTDRSPGLNHTLETLGLEIACALFPSDFNIYEIPPSILRRAKEMAQLREKKWSTWHRALSNTPGILDYSRAAIFALIRTAPENIHLAAPGELQAYINKNLTETNHANPDQEVIAVASGISSASETGQHIHEDSVATEAGAVVKPEADFVKPA